MAVGIGVGMTVGSMPVGGLADGMKQREHLPPRTAIRNSILISSGTVYIIKPVLGSLY